MNLTAREIMGSPVITIREDTPAQDLVALLSEKAISGVPVVDGDGKLVGVVSITDLLAANLGDDEFGQADFHTSPSMDGLAEMNTLLSPSEEVAGQPVSELMSRNVITAEEDTPVSAISRTLVTHRIHRVVIVRDGQPVGVVSVGDILRALSGISDT